MVLDERTHGWEDIWQCRDDNARTRTNKAIKEAISEAKVGGAEGAILTTGRKIAETAGKFKKNTSVGLDLWAIKEIAQCDQEDLDKLAGLLEKYDGVVLKVSSYTDSRGTTTYNDWLSRRRVERTVDYLIQQSIGAERLIPEGYGEENLLNECDDNTYCPEEKHKINRRSEFKVVSF